MWESIEVLDKEIELKNNKINVLADKVGISAEEIIKQMKKINVTKFWVKQIE